MMHRAMAAAVAAVAVVAVAACGDDSGGGSGGLGAGGGGGSEVPAEYQGFCDAVRAAPTVGALAPEVAAGAVQLPAEIAGDWDAYLADDFETVSRVATWVLDTCGREAFVDPDLAPEDQPREVMVREEGFCPAYHAAGGNLDPDQLSASIVPPSIFRDWERRHSDENAAQIIHNYAAQHC